MLPVYHRENDVRMCLEAFRLTRLGNAKLSMVLAVNGASDDFAGYLEAVARGVCPGVPEGAVCSVRRFDHNVGKGEAVNRVVSATVARGGVPEFVLSFDPDLIARKPEWFDDLMAGYEASCSVFPTGAVVSDQYGCCCHTPLEPSDVEVGDVKLTYSTGNVGQAGGCLLTPYKVWREAGGYEAKRVYGSDDGHYMHALHRLGYRSCIVRTCSLFHLDTNDAGYRDWKFRALKDELAGAEKEGYYEGC